MDLVTCASATSSQYSAAGSRTFKKTAKPKSKKMFCTFGLFRSKASSVKRHAISPDSPRKTGASKSTQIFSTFGLFRSKACTIKRHADSPDFKCTSPGKTRKSKAKRYKDDLENDFELYTQQKSSQESMGSCESYKPPFTNPIFRLFKRKKTKQGPNSKKTSNNNDSFIRASPQCKSILRRSLKTNCERKSDGSFQFILEMPGAEKNVRYCETIHMKAVKWWDKKAPNIPRYTMTPKQLSESKMKLNQYKLEEMRIHPASKQCLDLYHNGRERKWKKQCRKRVKKLNASLYSDHPEDSYNEREVC